MNGIVEVRPNVPFKLLFENYSNKKYELQKNQTVAYLLPQPNGVIPTTINLEEVLVLRNHRYGARDTN